MKKIPKTIILAIIPSVLLFCCLSDKEEEIKIFHAGSLSVPIGEVSKEFKKIRKVEILAESSGSIEVVRKVTDLKKMPDLVAVADHQLVSMLIPEYTDFYILFAKNEIVIAFSENSKFANEINEENWFEILQREGVKFGFSDPNFDPCGYRALIVLKLADLFYEKPIFESLIEKNTNIRSLNNTIIVPERVESNSKIVLRPKEVELTSFVEIGALDYYFIYKSVAKQHNLRSIELPPEINLGSYEMQEHYSKIEIKINGKSFKAHPIVYAVTILKNSQNREIVIDYINFLLGSEGKRIFKENYQEFIEPLIVVGTPPKGLVVG